MRNRSVAQHAAALETCSTGAHLHHHELPHGCAIDRPLTHEEIAHTSTPCTAPAAPAAVPGAAKSTPIPSCAAGSSTQWRTERQWDMQRFLCKVWRLCARNVRRVHRNTPNRWKRTAPAEAPLGRITLLSPADMIASIRRPVPQRGDDQEPGARMAPRRGTRRPSRRDLSEVALTWHALELQEARQVVKEVHSHEQQHSNTQRLFIKLCWLMSTHAVSADRVVNIDETSCRLLPVHQFGWSRRGVKQAQLQCKTGTRHFLTV